MSEFLFRFLRRASLWLFWPAVALIIWGELAPNPPALIEGLWDKAEHFIAYFGLAVMATLALGLRRLLAWAIFGIINLGGALEVAQHFVGRDAEVMDMIANTLGVVAGLCLAAVFLTLVEPTAEDYPAEE
jgi:VanZ family protein